MAKPKNTTKICRHCQNDMRAGDKVCPTCGRKQGRGCLGCLIPILLVLIGIFIGIVLLTPDSEDENTSEDGKEYVADSYDDVKEAYVVAEMEYGVVYEDHKVKISTTSYEESSSGVEIGLLIENNSDLNLGFNAHAYGVNGIMTGNNIYDMDCDVAAGKKANTKLNIDADFLTEYNMTEIQYIDLFIWAYDNDKSFKEFDTGVIHLVTSLNKDEVLDYDEKELLSQKGISVKYIGSEGDNYIFAIKNMTGEVIDFDVENITINDFTVSDDYTDYDLIGECILNNNTFVITIQPDERFLEENKINSIQSIEFNLDIRPNQDYFEEWNTDTVKVSIE